MNVLWQKFWGTTLFMLSVKSSIVHWDEKLLPAIIGIEKVERLPVIISTNEQEHLLRALKLASSSADDIAATIHFLLNESHHLEIIQVILEKNWKKIVYNFLSDTIYELVLKCALLCLQDLQQDYLNDFKKLGSI